MAYAFAEYANRIWPQADGDRAACVLVRTPPVRSWF